ncbi:MAG: glycoside hydrolase family 127 protein [Proteobacteria bacterium]|nr:glycoside hydrolase family 127 protein [Pseudomonadota bacterium]
MHALLKSTCEIPMPIERTLKLTEQINPVLSNECRRRLRYMHMQSFDWKYGGLMSTIKFIDRDSVEYSLVVAADHDQDEIRMAKLTLDNAVALVDTVWGGVYQYSTQGKWNVPHYRKTMSAQAGHLRLYSLAYAQLKSDQYLNVTNSIQTYIKNFMSSETGAFYSGQTDNIAGINPMLFFSLNESERQLIGIPDIDKRILTRENGWIIEALATHYEYCGSQQSLNMAINAATWINKHCKTNAGGYLTNTMTESPTHLSDTLAMARAMLQLYRATFDKRYLDYACQSADFINQHFRNELCAYNSRILSDNDATPPRQMDENIALTRFVNLLSYYSGEQRFTKIAKQGLRYLSIPEIATARMEEAGILNSAFPFPVDVPSLITPFFTLPIRALIETTKNRYCDQ